MAERVIAAQEISLNGQRYRLNEPIRPVLINQFAPKVAQGEVGSEHLLRRSIVKWTSAQEGIGIDRVNEATIRQYANRVWYSNAWLRQYGAFVLPPLTTTTAASGVSGIFTIGAISELNDLIYAAFSTSVRVYSSVVNSWTDVATLPAGATDALNFRLGGTFYMAFATTGGFSYTSNGEDWTDDTTDTEFMAFWDDRLWGISSAGQLWYSLAIGTEVNDAQLPLKDNSVTDLFVASDARGEQILYAATKVGLWAHDVENTRWVQTRVTFPLHNNGGQGTFNWRDAIHTPAGLSLYEYVPGATATLRTVGPDRDDGLPQERRGTVVHTNGTHNDLIVLIDSTSAGANDFDVFPSASLNDTAVLDVDVGVSTMAAWDRKGWQILWEANVHTEAATTTHVSFAHSFYRIWWSHNRLIHYQDLPVDVINPNEERDFHYAASAFIDWPFFQVGQENTGLALRLRVETADCSSNETVQIQYATDFDDSSFTTLGTISTNGITTYEFPDSTTPSGTEFRSIRFRANLARGDDTLLSPTLIALTFEWRKKLAAQYGWQVSVDLGKPYAGNSPQAQRANLVTAAGSASLVEFTYREDTGNTRNYYVDVVDQRGLENTGRDETGVAALTLAEI
jgi:frataxin-like iron-binding protein CyaY